MHKLKENAHDKWMTYLYMRKADQNKYGSLMKGFKTQYRLDNDQYPKTMLKATTVLTGHKWDDKYYQVKKSKKGNNNNTNENGNRGNNNSSDNTNDNNSIKNEKNEEEGTNLHQKDRSDITCFCCGKKGHFSNKCPKQDDIDKKDWAIKQGLTLV